jgi:hypothetical protein
MPTMRGISVIIERSEEHLIAFIDIAFIFILVQHLKSLVAEDLGA